MREYYLNYTRRLEVTRRIKFKERYGDLKWQTRDAARSRKHRGQGARELQAGEGAGTLDSCKGHHFAPPFKLNIKFPRGKHGVKLCSVSRMAPVFPVNSGKEAPS